jgi:putative RecB family exonuclease
LSPSRAADFKTCPLLFRFRTIDRLPERPSPDQVRGTLVHAVLERLFDLPPGERTTDAAVGLVAPQWQRMVEEQPDLRALFDDPGAPPVADALPLPVADALPLPVADALPLPVADALPLPAAGGAAAPDGPVEDPTEVFLRSARGLLDGYFAVEDPRRLEPAERESLISTMVDGELLIRGYIDRLDISPTGDLRVVDYKTGGAPREAFEARALFQLKFYALVLWRTRGVVPKVLRLLYLKDAEICDYSPDAEELQRFERTLVALWRAIERATAARDFRPRPSKLCGWCSHQERCPAFGGTPPPFPEPPAVADAGQHSGAVLDLVPAARPVDADG